MPAIIGVVLIAIEGAASGFGDDDLEHAGQRDPPQPPARAVPPLTIISPCRQGGRDGPSGIAELQGCILVMLLQTMAAASAEFAGVAWSWSLIFPHVPHPIRAVGACARPGHAWR
jgi:hypothetical protein